jgi:hypothetical protein
MEEINGRQPQKVFKICAGGMAGTTAAALGLHPKWRWLRRVITNCCAPKEIRILLRGLRAINV